MTSSESGSQSRRRAERVDAVANRERILAAAETYFAQHGIDATKAAMFDDLEKNLLVPHDVGMVTVQVVAAEDFVHDQVESWELGRSGEPHVHHVTDNLATFLRGIR
jgi:putative hydrolase of the HAD superfamily